MIKSNMGKPGQQEKALGRFIASLTQDDIYNLRRNIYQRLDILLPGYGMRSRFASFFCLVFGLGKWSENHSCRCDLQVLPDSASWARSLQAVNHATVFHCWQNHRDDNGDVPATSHDGGGRSVCLLLEAFQTFGLMILSRLFLCPLSTHTHTAQTLQTAGHFSLGPPTCWLCHPHRAVCSICIFRGGNCARENYGWYRWECVSVVIDTQIKLRRIFLKSATICNNLCLKLAWTLFCLLRWNLAWLAEDISFQDIGSNNSGRKHHCNLTGIRKEREEFSLGMIGNLPHELCPKLWFLCNSASFNSAWQKVTCIVTARMQDQSGSRCETNLCERHAKRPCSGTCFWQGGHNEETSWSKKHKLAALELHARSDFDCVQM